jgi:uncharacterized membrane protein (DUF106 family)
MTWLNGAMGAMVGAMVFPFQSLPPIVGLSVVSLAAAIGMLLVFRATSNQEAIAAVKRKIQAGIFEIRLFNDDLRAMFHAQIDILRHNLTYIRLSLAPMVWMIVPLVLVIAQLQFYYGYDGLSPGQSAVVKVVLKEGAAPAVPALALELEAPAGVRVETPMVWIPSLREAAWRVAADQAGDYQLSVSLGGRAVTKQFRVSDRVGWRTPERLERGLVNQLLYPAEAPIDSDVPIEAIYVSYPERAVNLFGWETHWMIAFFLLSIVFAFALKKRFGVVI